MSERLNSTITSKISDETRKEIESLVASCQFGSLGEVTRWLLQLGIEKSHELFAKEWEEEKAARGPPEEDDC
jgi:Arc/MetJ-type ribon-helix-helix transcriptional regulator